MREEGSLKNSNGERPNPVKTTTPQNVYANTNPVTQPRVSNKPLPLAGGTGGTIDKLAAQNSISHIQRDR